MEHIFPILLAGVLSNNYALQNYLGVSTMLGASKETVKSAVTGIAVTVVMVIAMLVIWPVQTFVLAPYGLEYLQTLVFVTVIVAVASLVGIILNAVLPGNDYKFGNNEQGDQSVNFKV